MSSSWLAWIVLSAATRNPVLAAVMVLAFGFLTDRYTFGVFPGAFRYLRRRSREGQLRRLLMQNAHDRRARAELADLLILRGKYDDALPLVRTNVEAGDEDPNTLYLMGLSCLGAGHKDQGELFLEELKKTAPTFRLGAADLELGRFRLKRGDSKGAIDALQTYCAGSPGTVEGKVLLAQAYDLSGDDVKAAYIKRDAWRDFVAAPRFQRRRERLWAWRANPSRPLLYLGVCVSVVALVVALKTGAAS